MFKGGNFDVIDVPLPTEGMNQNIAPEQLSTKQTYHLENIIPSPLGYGKIRYGTELLSDMSDHIPHFWEIQEVFNYTTKESKKQLLLYVQGFIYDTPEDIIVDDLEATIAFNSRNGERYIQDTPVRIEFTLMGEDQISLYVKEVKSNEGRITLFFDKVEFLQGMKVNRIMYPTGNIYCYDLDSKKLNSVPLMKGLAINSVPRSAYFQRQLLICNGVDKVMKWDGEKLDYVINWVPTVNKKEDNLRKMYDNVIRFNTNKSFNFKKECYTKGNKIRIKIDEKNTELEVKNLQEIKDYVGEIFLMAGSEEVTEEQKRQVLEKEILILRQKETKEKYLKFFIGYAEKGNKFSFKYIEEEIVKSFIPDKINEILIKQVYGDGSQCQGKDRYIIRKWLNDEILSAIEGALLFEKIVMEYEITTTKDVPDFYDYDDNETVILYHQDYPPRLSYIKVMNNRIWGFKEGVVGLKYRKDSMTVLYSYKPESLTDWFSDTTKAMPYINMSYEHGRHDSFEAIATIGDNIAFIGRHNTQIWKGKNPNEANQFVWQSTIEGGVAHGNLVLPIGNDVFLVSQQGLMKLSTFNKAKQLVIEPLKSMNPFIQNCLKTVLQSDIEYRKCRAFNYTRGSFAGFKLGNYEPIIAMVTGGVDGFCLFSGSFQKAYAFNVGGENLLMTDGDKILQYQDYSTDSNSYTDNGTPINFVWSLPIVNGKGKKYACKRFEIYADYSSEFVMEDGKEQKDKNFVAVNISGDLRKTFEMNTPYLMDFQGDVLGEIHLDSGGYRLGAPYQITKTRLKFVSTSFWCTLHGTVTTGHFIIKNLRFYGRAER